MCPVPCSLGFARGHSPFAFPLRSDFCWRDGYLPYSRSPWACERALAFHISLGFPLFLARRPSCHIPLGLQKDKALSHFPLGLDLFVGWATIVALFPPGFARGQSPFAFPLGSDFCWRDGHLPYSRFPWACERALPFHISLGFQFFWPEGLVAAIFPQICKRTKPFRIFLWVWTYSWDGLQ